MQLNMVYFSIVALATNLIVEIIMNENIKRMAEMNMKKLIMVMSLPAIISMFVMALYNVVDSIFISKIGSNALTAVSLAFPVQLVMISIIVGLGIGINSYVSRKIGEGRLDVAAIAAEHGIILGLVVWLLLSVLNYLFIGKFYAQFSTDPEIIRYSLQYTNIVVYGSIGMIMSVILNQIQQATGDMINPMKTQILGAVTNIILDPIMIFGLLSFPRLNVVGGATATVIGQLISMIYALIKLKHNPLQLKLSKLHLNFRLDMDIIREILKVGIPSMFIEGLAAIMVGCINLILSGFSVFAVAAFGAFFKLNAIVIMPVIGLTQGMMPVVGYSFGAKNNDRIKGAIKYSMIYAIAFMLLGSTLLIVFARPIMEVFSSLPELIALGVSCTRIISLSFTLLGITVILSSAFQAFGIGQLSMYASFLRQIVLLIPLAYVLSRMIGVTGVWMAFPLTEALSLLFTITYALKIYRSRVKPVAV